MYRNVSYRDKPLRQVSYPISIVFYFQQALS